MYAKQRTGENFRTGLVRRTNGTGGVAALRGLWPQSSSTSLTSPSYSIPFSSPPPADSSVAISVLDLSKVYGDGAKALDAVSFSVKDGEIFGLLGPNGAGKTTTIKIITTMIRPSSGTAKIAGVDVLQNPRAVRQMIGYVPQAISVDGDLTALENLLIFSKLFYVSKKDREARIKSALEYMGLIERADDLVKHFSGGMMRRLEIAQALVNRPRILILDEPSIGLDPASKRAMWDYIKKLNRDFHTTVLITTHDMVEADELCERVAIMNNGKIAVIGNPKDLKRSVGGDIITVTFSKQQNITRENPETQFSQSSNGVDSASNASAVWAPDIILPVNKARVIANDGATLKIMVENGEKAVPRLFEYFETEGLVVESISLSKPTLDDVFMKYANVKLADDGAPSRTFREARTARRNIARRSG
ncbi:MAG TPA: ATP-binding cassette domain-containing protein [Nitrososphaerales archaeon]|nr:ATP-binding cassette domain-containing protein [Nitrososphaerales archaeon]